MNYKHMQEAYALMEEKKSTLTSTWKTAEKELSKLKSQLKNLEEYLGTGGAESMQSHVHEENHEEEQKNQNQSSSQRKTVSIYNLKKCIKISGTHPYWVSTGLVFSSSFKDPLEICYQAVISCLFFNQSYCQYEILLFII